jgi:Tfp pilus assembly protein PilP
MRKALLSIAALALAASVVVGMEKPSQAPAAPASRIDARVRAPELDLSRLERPAQEEPKVDVFAVPEEDAKNRGTQSQGKPARPQAPPLPFAYLGRMLEDGKLAVFLARGAESYSVQAGDTIGGEYRVDTVTDKEVTFTYLPLKTKQRLPL